MLELVVLHPKILQQNLSTIIHSTCPFIVHEERPVRKELRRLLQFIFPILSENTMKPYMGFYVAHVGNALTSLFSTVRIFGLELLQMLIENYESQCAQYSAKILPNLFNVFQMRTAGISYKGKNHLIQQELSVNILDRYLGVLLEHNKLKIPNYVREISHPLFFHHSHVQNKLKKDDLDQQREFMFARNKVLPHIAFTFNSVSDQRMQMYHRLIQRKVADKSKIMFESEKKKSSSSTSSSSDQVPAAEQQQKQQKSKDSTKDSSSHHVLMLSEDVTNYSMETEQSLNLMIHKFSSPLSELYMEFYSPLNPSIVHNSLHSIYQLLYALEEVSTDVIDTAKMQNDFPFFKYLRRKGEVQSHLGKTNHFSCRSAWIGITSFFDIDETIVQLLSVFCKNRFDGDARDFAILLGAFWRVSRYLTEDVELALWKGLTNIFLNESHLSLVQTLILQFFSDIVLKKQKMTPAVPIFKVWAKQLPVLLSMISPEQIGVSKFLVSALSAFSKSLHQCHLTPDSLFPLFAPNFFLALPSQYQTPLLYLLFHSPDVKISNDILKSMSQICTSTKCESGVASVLIEFIAVQNEINPVDKTTFLLSVICGKPELISEIIVAFSNIEDALNRISGFMCHMLPKDLDMRLQSSLLALVYNALVWRGDKTASENKLTDKLMNSVLPARLFKFYEACFIHREFEVLYIPLCMNLCTIHSNLLAHLLESLSKSKQSISLEMTLTLLKSLSNTSVQQHATLWNQLYVHLTHLVKKELKDTANVSNLGDSLHHIHSQMILHQIEGTKK